MRVVDYTDGVVSFYCAKCDFRGEYDLTSLISDNCAFDIEVICELCNDHTVLYFLRCTDPVLEKELNAKFEALKDKRRGCYDGS